jgi:hypothetical protein
VGVLLRRGGEKRVGESAMHRLFVFYERESKQKNTKIVFKTSNFKG